MSAIKAIDIKRTPYFNLDDWREKKCAQNISVDKIPHIVVVVMTNNNEKKVIACYIFFSLSNRIEHLNQIRNVETREEGVYEMESSRHIKALCKY